ISLFAFGELRVSDSTFTNNKGFNGGAIHVTSSDLFVENSTFIGNDSTPGKDRINYIPGAGGAIYADAATVPRDEKFYGLLPEHELQGEAEGGVISVNNSYFEKNKASGQGGALALWGYSQDEVFVTNNVIVDNEVILNKDNMAEGGGVWLMGYGTVENNTIANNRSEDKGGGLFIWGEVPTTVSNTTFSNNQAAKGGAIYSDIWDTQLNVNDSNFDSNSASVEGGVLYTNKIRPVYIENSQISNNTAADIVNVNSSSDLSGFTYGASSPPVSYESPVEQSYTPEPEPTPEIVVQAPVEQSYTPEPEPEVTYQAPIEQSYEPNKSDLFIDSRTLKLNSDSQFAGKPDYTPADNTGMYVWQTGNTWNIEVTGDWDASHFRGKIVADQAIQNLTEQSFETNDSVWHTDASRHSIEFSMIVGNDWTDGISFDIAYQADATLYLEMDNGETLPIKVGSSMIGDYSVDTAVAAPAIEPSYTPEPYQPEVVYAPPVEQSHNDNNLMSAPISGGLELNQDALFSSKPSYNPSEQSGLIVWNTEDVWHMEATGTPATSHYRGRIVSDQAIED
ncbi:MAG: hypothetical protein AAGJ80_06215, partial [Cyanobacteria bacterium J06553_1]